MITQIIDDEFDESHVSLLERYERNEFVKLGNILDNLRGSFRLANDNDLITWILKRRQFLLARNHEVRNRRNYHGN